MRHTLAWWHHAHGGKVSVCFVTENDPGILNLIDCSY